MKLTIFLIFLTGGMGFLLQSAASTAPSFANVDSIFAELHSSNAPGGAVLVIRNGKIVFQRGYGVTDLSTRTKIDEDTNFRLASVTKQFTAMAIMLLVHDGKLRYEARITDIFPDFAGYGKAITIRNLLNHTSGLPDYEDLMPQADPKLSVEETQINDEGVLDLLKQQKAGKFAPGTKWEYSNSGYVLLGLIVRKVSGQGFEDFLHDRIFSPLKMTGTVAYVRGKNQVSRRAYGHEKGPHGWRQADQSPTSATLGDGGVYSSIADLAKWDEALREHTLLSANEMKEALSPVRVTDNSVRGPDGAPAEYGFGWFLNPYKGHSRMWHYGETMGFRTNIQRFVEDGLTIITLCNRDDLDPGQLGLRVADVYLQTH
jgi:CubicO group peptidase (beta-lactamase class C family)